MVTSIISNSDIIIIDPRMRYLLLLFALVFSVSISFSQEQIEPLSSIDSSLALTDSVLIAERDSLLAQIHSDKMNVLMKRADSVISFSSSLQQWLLKPFTTKYDIQQKRMASNNTNMFLLLLGLILITTYLKLAFANDLEELWLSVSSTNRAAQIFRTQTDTITVSSFLLLSNFVLCSSLFVQFSILHFVSSINTNAYTTSFYLIILFTSFLLVRTLLLRTIGFVFSAKEVTALYEFHFIRLAQTLGLALLPIVLVMYVANKKYFDVVFTAAIMLIVVALVLLVVRGLSTSAKVALNNTKYFFIYVCIGEVALAFLFIKLLTKIVT